MEAVGAHSYSFGTTYTHCSIGFTPRLRSCRSWIRAAAEGGGDTRRSAASLAADGPRVVEVPVATTGGFGARDAELAMWDKLGAVVRLTYGIGNNYKPYHRSNQLVFFIHYDCCTLLHACG
jgi:hypothetical protein